MVILALKIPSPEAAVTDVEAVNVTLTLSPCKAVMQTAGCFRTEQRDRPTGSGGHLVNLSPVLVLS